MLFNLRNNKNVDEVNLFKKGHKVNFNEIQTNVNATILDNITQSNEMCCFVKRYLHRFIETYFKAMKIYFLLNFIYSLTEILLKMYHVERYDMIYLSPCLVPI